MTKYEEIAEFITMERKRQGVTQYDIAKSCGRSRASIANFEMGKQKPDIDIMEKMLNRLGYTIEFNIVEM